MITRETISLGDRIRNVDREAFYYNAIATVTGKGYDGFSIKYDSSEQTFFFFWDVDSFKFEPVLVSRYRRATLKDLVVGAKIKSVVDLYHTGIINKTGTLINILPSGWTGCQLYEIRWDDDSNLNTLWTLRPGEFAAIFDVIDAGKKRKPKKIIPDIPLDPSLPILEAGYLQDRMRKQFR